MVKGACMNAQIVEVIKVVVTEGGGNSKEDPIRHITQYWSKDGNLLFNEGESTD